MNKVFRLGDKVRIIRSECGSVNEVGEVGEIVAVYLNNCQVHVEGRSKDIQNFHPFHELELVEDKVEPIIINPTKVESIASHPALDKIAEMDIDFYFQLEEFLSYLASTYNDKYEVKGVNYAKDRLMKEDAKSATLFNALKYIKRYDTVGFAKSENPQDLYKAIHYLLFELQRKEKCQGK